MTDHPGAKLWVSIVNRGMTVTEAAKYLGVGRPNLSAIVNGRRGISIEMAIRLEKKFPEHTARWWLRRQVDYDLEMERR